MVHQYMNIQKCKLGDLHSTFFARARNAMTHHKPEPESESLFVEVAGTLVALMIIGAGAYVVLYLRGLSTPPNFMMLVFVLVVIAIASLGGKLMRAFRNR
jgi:hypothetical protein